MSRPATFERARAAMAVLAEFSPRQIRLAAEAAWELDPEFEGDAMSWLVRMRLEAIKITELHAVKGGSE